MLTSLVPVLLLAAVALSSSNVLPMLTTNQHDTETYGIDGQQNDNIFSNKFNTRDVPNSIYYKVPFGTFQIEKLPKQIEKYVNTNNNRAEDSFESAVNREDNYDDEGFRKEQWHNYPRQLDRLHNYLSRQYNTGVKQRLDHDDPDNINHEKQIISDKNFEDIATNEIRLDSNGVHNIYDAVVTSTNPLLILKIHLACLSNTIKNHESQLFQIEHNNDYLEEKGEEEKLFTNENPAEKVKRQGAPVQDTETSDDSTGTKKFVSKRLFSLWSRLQSLSHNGHDLPHRRHLHAFYGLPDADGGVLTAETRATLMRPPGSPLRWG